MAEPVCRPRGAPRAPTTSRACRGARCASLALPKPVDLSGLLAPGSELAVGTTSIAVVTPTVRGADHLVDMLASPSACSVSAGTRRRAPTSSAGSTAIEVATAVQERLPIRVFVFNDQRLGMVEHGHRKVYGRQPRFPTGPLDVCLIARGLGAASLRVETVAALREAEALLRHAPGPVVIDVAIAPAICMPEGDRIAAMKDDTSSSAFGVPLEARRRVTNGGATG